MSTRRRYLFLHQNFPGQFLHIAPALARQGHEVYALSTGGRPLPGVTSLRYTLDTSPVITPRPSHLDAQLLRAHSVANRLLALKREGYHPDLIIAHPGWGEALFCKDVWPSAKLLIFAEFFYTAEGADAGFDPEFPMSDETAARMAMRLKNTVHLHAYHAADAIYAPTRWQRSQIPEPYRDKAVVVFDGIDTDLVSPDPNAVVRLRKAGRLFRPGDELISFVNRNLEPYRGFHIFMRALPDILRHRPQAHCLIVGGNDVSYGKKHPSGKPWRQVMLEEVGNQLPMARVHFVGKVPYADYLRLLQVSACHVYLTYPFVLSWSCLEAMSAGGLVIGSRTAPVEEVIEDGVNGRLVDFFDTQTLAQTVADVLADPQAQPPLRRQARQTVIERYDLKRVCLPQLMHLIEGL